MNYHTALSVVIALVDALESTYLPSIINLPNRTFVMPQASASTASAPTNPSNNDDDEEADNGVSFSDMLLAAVDDDLTKSVQEESKLIMAINSAFMSGEFVESLEAKIDEFCTTSFPHETQITECLPKPISELKESFRAIVSNEVKEVLTTGISKRMEPLVNRLMLDRIEYELTAPQYDAYGLHGSPLNKLVEFEVLKNKVLRRYQTALCASAFEDLVECFVQDLTRWLEASLVRFRKRFNDLGALQLEREITDMLDRVSQLVQTKSLRGSFTRLFQLVLIVNLMQPSEIVDYADSITTDLTLPEIETFLRMRVDFKDDDVRRAMSALQRAVGKQ
jgi:conserved oligomeric Golgi complex subunit 4